MSKNSNIITKDRIDYLLPLCIKGNNKAEKELYNAYISYIYTICKRYFIPEDYLKDIIQDIFSNMFNSLENYKSDLGSFKSWLRKIAIYKIIDFKRRQNVPNLELFEFTNVLSIPPKVIDQLYLEELLELMEAMPDGYRNVLNMYLIEGFSHKEIGEHLNISAQTSRSQLSRAKDWLRRELSKQNKSDLIASGFIKSNK